MNEIVRDVSWTGRRWTMRPTSAVAGELARTHGLSPLASQCLAHRTTPASAAAFLAPAHEHLHDPSLMFGMNAAVARIRKALEDRQRIRIVTDYDVDGTTSSLILQNTLALLGGRDLVDYHIPDRFDEGYGFSARAASRAVADGVGLVLTADIGVRDHASVTTAAAGGTDVIICDHHLPEGAGVPEDAHTVLCPPQAACSYPNPALAACGVSLKLAQALLVDHPKAARILRSMLKVAAIGTVADVVDLATPENRAIVALGLGELSRGPHAPGLQALLEVAGLGAGPLQASDLGFRLGPRINAAGRLSDASAVVELFSCRDPTEARRRAAQLDLLNRQRQGIQRRLVKTCIAGLSEPTPGFVVAWGPEAEGWHRGVVGIVAAKVRDHCHRPVAVVAVSGDEAKGSVRSVPGIHAVRALDAAGDLLDRYGGHPAAAGFSVATDKLPALAERLAGWVDAGVETEALVPELVLDAACSPSELNRTTLDELERIGPFGKGNPAPLLTLSGVRTARPGPLGTGHLRFEVDGLDCVWWRGADHEAALATGPVDLVGRLELNRWKGRERLRFTVEDGRKAQG